MPEIEKKEKVLPFQILEGRFFGLYIGKIGFFLFRVLEEKETAIDNEFIIYRGDGPRIPRSAEECATNMALLHICT